MPNESPDHDDFLDEAPTAVMIRRLIEEAIVEAQSQMEEMIEASLDDEDFDPAAFRAIGTR